MSVPTLIEVQKSAHRLRVVFDDGVEVLLDFDTLRNNSPAADGKPATPVSGVSIRSLEAVGNYAIKPLFSDGHGSGIYGWDLLRTLAGKA